MDLATYHSDYLNVHSKCSINILYIMLTVDTRRIKTELVINEWYYSLPCVLR